MSITNSKDGKHPQILYRTLPANIMRAFRSLAKGTDQAVTLFNLDQPRRQLTPRMI